MTGRIRLETVEGTNVVIKRATDRARREALQTEAEMLRAVRHPGVVELVELVTADDHDELVTTFAGSVTLADFRPQSLGAVAGVVAGVAAVLADLHGAGWSHGRVGPDHVIVGGSRHPVLCSMAACAAATEDSIAADLMGLAGLIDALAPRAAIGVGRAARRQRRALHAAADACRAPGATAADAAQRLAAVPGSIAPEPGRLDGTTPSPVGADQFDLRRPDKSPDRMGTRTWRDRIEPDRSGLDPRRTKFVALAGTAAIALLLTGLSSRRSAVTPLVDATTVTAAVIPVQSTAPAPSRPTVTPTPTEPPAVPCPDPAVAVDVDGDGCDDEVVVHGNLVEVNGRWLEAGVPGDVVRVGDWDCDGVVTPVLLRPDTGDVFVFDHWADHHVIEVPAASRHPGAVSLAPATADGCDVVFAVDASGVTAPEPIALS